MNYSAAALFLQFLRFLVISSLFNVLVRLVLKSSSCKTSCFWKHPDLQLHCSFITIRPIHNRIQVNITSTNTAFPQIAKLQETLAGAQDGDEE